MQLLVQAAKGRRLRPTTARLIRPILHLLAQGYGAALSAVKVVHKHKRRPLPVPTICVGNLTCGGTGKTPMASHIASLLFAEAGLVPLVLTRVRYCRGRYSALPEMLCCRDTAATNAHNWRMTCPIPMLALVQIVVLLQRQ